MNLPSRLSGCTLLLLAGTALAQPLAGGAVYRCHALDGSTQFQDRPCNQSAGTREAAQGLEGVRIAADAPPPAEDAAIVAARYRRYLDQVDADRRIAAEADSARAARLHAEAAVDAARADREALERGDRHDGDPFDGNRWLPVYLPGNRPFVGRPIRPLPIILAPPPPPPPGPRPTRPPPREPRDVRSEILDTRR